MSLEGWIWGCIKGRCCMQELIDDSTVYLVSAPCHQQNTALPRRDVKAVFVQKHTTRITMTREIPDGPCRSRRAVAGLEFTSDGVPRML